MTETKKRPSARAGATKGHKKPKLRLIPGGKAPRPSRRLVSCEDGFCGTGALGRSVGDVPAPTPEETNVSWARLAAAVVLELDFRIPGLDVNTGRG